MILALVVHPLFATRPTEEGAPAAADELLNEDGSPLLNEDGSELLNE